MATTRNAHGPVGMQCSLRLPIKLGRFFAVTHSGCTSEIFRISSTENTFKTFISRVLVCCCCCCCFLICSSLPLFLLPLPYFGSFAVLRSVHSNRSLRLSVRLHHPNRRWRDLNKIWSCGILRDISNFRFDYIEKIKYNGYFTCKTYIHSSNCRLTRHHNERHSTSHRRMRRTKVTLGCVWIVLERDFLHPLYV